MSQRTSPEKIREIESLLDTGLTMKRAAQLAGVSLWIAHLVATGRHHHQLPPAEQAMRDSQREAYLPSAEAIAEQCAEFRRMNPRRPEGPSAKPIELLCVADPR